MPETMRTQIEEGSAERAQVVRLFAEAPPAARDVQGEHSLDDGVRVTLSTTRVAVVRADGAPLFEYDASAAQAKITLSAESLELAARAGDLVLSAAGAIRLHSRSFSARAQMPGRRASLVLDPECAQLHAETLALKSGHFQLEADAAELRADTFASTLKRAQLTLERVETVAETIVSRARNVYQSTHELLQQRAGTLRTLVAGTAQLKAREIAQRAEGAYKVRGEKIHLG